MAQCYYLQRYRPVLCRQCAGNTIFIVHVWILAPATGSQIFVKVCLHCILWHEFISSDIMLKHELYKFAANAPDQNTLFYYCWELVTILWNCHSAIPTKRPMIFLTMALLQAFNTVIYIFKLMLFYRFLLVVVGITYVVDLSTILEQ